jgi:hypothetical protein
MNHSILRTVEKLYPELRNTELGAKHMEESMDDLQIVQKYLQLSKEETILFVLTLACQVKKNQCDYEYYCNYLSLSYFKIMDLEVIVEGLIKKNYLTAYLPARDRYSNSEKEQAFKVNPVLYVAITKELAFPEEQIKQLPDDFEWLSKIVEFINVRLSFVEKIELNKVIEEQLAQNGSGSLPKIISEIEAEPIYKLLVVYLIWSTVTSDHYIGIADFYNHFNQPQRYIFKETKLLSIEEHPLQILEVIKSKEALFTQDLEIGLEDQFKDKLREIGLILSEKEQPKTGKGTIKHEKIITKELYYNEQELKPMNKLVTILSHSNFESLKERMGEKGLNSGFCTLFYGAPGTGKTESVYQLAKQTQRDIIQVDLSELKSMWYGQSQKLVKAIFSSYNSVCDQSEKTPILLLNEADALLGKRMTNNESASYQTENAIQNILLEEMENFKGILIATTNLEVNLDQAFSRRFLFKLKFHAPQKNQLLNIWKNKLPNLTEEELSTLVEQFNLTGGQVDNVVRKIEMDFILESSSTSFEEIMEYCKEEYLYGVQQNQIKIGFR